MIHNQVIHDFSYSNPYRPYSLSPPPSPSFCLYLSVPVSVALRLLVPVLSLPSVGGLLVFFFLKLKFIYELYETPRPLYKKQRLM